VSLVIEMKNITKTFPGVKANDDITFEVEENEIHCLLGENGTGKSTLMNILFGLYKPDKGEIFINGEKSTISNPREAFHKGIGMVHQHFMLVNQMTVLENIILGKEHGNLFMDLKESRNIINELAGKYSFKIDLEEKVDNLSVGMKQRVEILKTLYRGADIIILDEPTAVLTPQEVEELFKILKSLKEDGKTIIFITHKLNETMELSDRITVLRKGRKVVTLAKTETSPAELAYYMVGRDVNFEVEKEEVKTGEAVLSIKGLKLLEKSQNKINLEVRAGEILGIAGVEGNGQLELEEIIMGLRKPLDGEVFIQNKNITKMSVRERRELGIGYIPSDRHKRAMVKEFSIKENYLLGYQDSEQFVRNKFVKYKVLNDYSRDMIEKFNIKVPGTEHTIGNLSGGNQQKVILSREVSHDPGLIIAAQPIRGLDIGAIEFIHNILLELRSQGKAILLISAELSEIMKLSDRIAVFYEGEINGLVKAGELEREEIGLLMAGERLEKYGK
jgi:ABC-type uncharacterized transport system ATPase subunit